MATGSSIQLANASFTKRIKASLTCPDRTGLLGEYILAKDAARCLRNIQNGALPLTATGAGTPIYNANSVVLSGSVSYGNGIAGFSTGIVTPANFTLIAVRKKLSGGVSAFASVPWFGAQANTTGFMEYEGWNFYNSKDGAPPGVAKVVGAVDGDFHFVAGTATLAGLSSIYAASAGVMASNTGSANGGGSRPAGALAIVPAGNVQIELAYAAIYERVLTAGEVSAAYAALKAYFASRGVVVS